MAKIDTLQDSRVRIEIEVTPEEFEHGLDHAFDKIKDEVEIKGFRKGKVTRKVFEQHKGVEALYEEALNHVIGETYYNAIMENELQVVAQPKIDLDITTVEKGKPFSYTATVAVKPELKLGEYKGLKYEKPSDEVTEEEIDVEINKLLGQNAELIVKENGELAETDTAVFDFEGFVDGEAFEGGKAENYELVIGSGQFIPDFEKQMVGMKAGEGKDIVVTFPEDYQAENLAGKEATFKVTLHEVKEKEVPSLNDEFVKDLDREGIETVEQLKADTLETLKQQKAEANKNAAVDFAVDSASKNAEVTLPEEMIVEEKNRMMDNTKRQAQQYGLELEQYLQFSGMDMEQFESHLMKDAERSIRYNLTLEAIAKEEDIKADDAEIDAKFDELAKQYNMEIDQIKSQVNPQAVAQEVVMKKTIDFLVDSLETE